MDKSISKYSPGGKKSQFEDYFLKGLSEKQSEAALSSEKRLLVLAGAGSGKTKTLIQKILHLVFVESVDSRSILAVTFTKNAANEMLDRLIMYANKPGDYKNIIENRKISYIEKEAARRDYLKRYKWIGGLTVKTFHSFCYTALRNHGAKSFDNRFKILAKKYRFTDALETSSSNIETPSQVMQKILIKLAEKKEFLLKLKQYILDFYVDKLHKRNEKSPHPDGLHYTTLDGNLVRSKSERSIADWLYRHDIKYVYEPDSDFTGEYSFHPDFYIPEANLFLEHVSNLSYSMKDKEDQFIRGDQLLVKTYESMTHDISSFHQTLEKLLSGRLSHKILPNSSLTFKEEFRSYHEYLKFFINEVLRVTDIIKAEDLDVQSILEKGKSDQHDRVKLFYELMEPILKNYIKYTLENSYMDFNDLILEALKALNNFPDIRKHYQDKLDYILVDEFQDVNSLQVNLIKMLLKENTQLFCVGDDWQSIYGFRGSQIDYIIKFHDHFKNSRVIKLNVNYRSNDTIVRASNTVINNNKNKLDKELKAVNKKGAKINLYISQLEEEDGVDVTKDKILQLSKNGYSKEDILILYRRHSVFEPYWDKLQSITGKFSHKTVHASKGLEAKIVFIIGLNGSDYGFPFLMESDRIFQIFKPVDTNLLLEEERRLFYVAMTRAREQLYLVSEQGNESMFISEITDKYLERENFLKLEFSQNETLCKSCRKELLEDFNFCPYCSQAVNEAKMVQKKEVKKKTEDSNDYYIEILKAFISLEMEIGRSFLSKYLNGSQYIKNTHADLTSNESYGQLSDFSQKGIIMIIDKMIKEDFFTIVEKTYPNGQRPILNITKLGENTLKDYQG